METKQKFKFYDPCKVLGRAILPLPKSMKDLADKMNGKVMTLEEAVEMLIPAAQEFDEGSVRAVKQYGYLQFKFVDSVKHEHSYRLLRYKSV